MHNLSLVTAKITRENEQYNYRIVGRGEKYLVKHEDGENAGDKVIEKLTPFAKEPIVIEQVVLQKTTEIIGEPDEEFIYKAQIQFLEVNENTGKEKKMTRNYFVCANSTRDAFEVLSDYIDGFFSDSSIVSVVRTKIIEII